MMMKVAENFQARNIGKIFWHETIFYKQKMFEI